MYKSARKCIAYLPSGSSVIFQEDVENRQTDSLSCSVTTSILDFIYRSQLFSSYDNCCIPYTTTQGQIRRNECASKRRRGVRCHHRRRWSLRPFHRFSTPRTYPSRSLHGRRTPPLPLDWEIRKSNQPQACKERQDIPTPPLCNLPA